MVAKNSVIIVLVVLLLLIGSAFVRFENQRYAMAVGMCPLDTASLDSQQKCMDKAQTRTSFVSHLFYALFP